MDKFYRNNESKKIIDALLSCESLLVIGETGIGKSYFAYQLDKKIKKKGYKSLVINNGTFKNILENVAMAIGVDTETMEGKRKSTKKISIEIENLLETEKVIFIVDDADRCVVTIREWLEKIINLECPIILIATNPPARDIFLKLPRIELQPLKDIEIREIMTERAIALGLTLNNAQLSKLQSSCGGNPMLATRVIKEYYLGIKTEGIDHTQWIDGTPYLMACLMLLVIIRFVGVGTNSTSLYLIGGIITVFIGVTRILLYALPRKSNKLGK